MVRFKRRYILFEVVPHDRRQQEAEKINISEKEVVKAMRQAIHLVHGDFGLGSVLKSLFLKRFTPRTRLGIVTVQRGPHRLLGSSLAVICKIGQVDCSIKCLYMSGTVRGCLLYLASYHRCQIRNERKLAAITEDIKELSVSLTNEKELIHEDG